MNRKNWFPENDREFVTNKEKLFNMKKNVDSEYNEAIAKISNLGVIRGCKVEGVTV